MNLSDAYLDHLVLYIKSGDEDKSTLRGFLDSWFAYNQGGPFLNRNGKPVWFNKPDPKKNRVRDALLSMHFISKNAMETIHGKRNDRLIKEHSIPIAEIFNILHSHTDHSRDQIRDSLEKFYRLGVLTKEEDLKLKKKKLNSKMPPDWTTKDGVFARYDAIGIKNFRI
jgi:hypothetical protein